MFNQIKFLNSLFSEMLFKEKKLLKLILAIKQLHCFNKSKDFLFALFFNEYVIKQSNTQTAGQFFFALLFFNFLCSFSRYF